MCLVLFKCSESEVTPQVDNRSKWAPAGGKPEDLEALQGVVFVTEHEGTIFLSYFQHKEL